MKGPHTMKRWIAAAIIAATLAGCGSSGINQAQVRTVQRELRSLAIRPIRPLPGATTAEWQTYEDALQSYCDLQPHAHGCP